MAARIFEEAWSGNISGDRIASSVCGSCHRKEKHLCHAIMPNVRIALAISRSQYHLYGKRGPNSRGGKFAMTDDPSRPATAASAPERKAAHAGGTARARRGRSAQESRGCQRQARSQGVSGPEGAGTDALWRLGEQRHRLGFLSANKKPRIGAAFRILGILEGDQCATTTVVPTETRWNRSLISAFNMRMQP